MNARWYIKYCGKQKRVYQESLPQRLYNKHENPVYIADPATTNILNVVISEKRDVKGLAGLIKLLVAQSSYGKKRGIFLANCEKIFGEHSKDILDNLYLCLYTDSLGEKQVIKLSDIMEILAGCNLDNVDILFKNDYSINVDYCIQIAHSMSDGELLKKMDAVWNLFLPNNAFSLESDALNRLKALLLPNQDIGIVGGSKKADVNTIKEYLSSGLPDNGPVNSIYKDLFVLAHVYGIEERMVHLTDKSWYITFDGELSPEEKDKLQLKLSEAQDKKTAKLLCAVLDGVPYKCGQGNQYDAGIPGIIATLYENEVLNGCPASFKNGLKLSFFSRGKMEPLLNIYGLMELVAHFNNGTTLQMLSQDKQGIDYETFRAAIQNASYDSSKDYYKAVSVALKRLLGPDYGLKNRALTLIRDTYGYNKKHFDELCGNLNKDALHNAALLIGYSSLNSNDIITAAPQLSTQPLNSLYIAIFAAAYLYSFGINGKEHIRTEGKTTDRRGISDVS